MIHRAGRLSTIIAPVLLAALTLSVFAKLQYYGPESAFRRFYEAALNGDAKVIDATTKEGSNSPQVWELIRRIQAFAQRGIRPQPLGMEVNAKKAVVGTVYTDPDLRLRVHVYWVLRPQGTSWKLGAEETLTGGSRMMGR
jgi:hypothetical protein